MGHTNENESPTPSRSLGSLTQKCFAFPTRNSLFSCLAARTKGPNKIQQPKKRLKKAAAATKQVQSQRYFKRPAQSSHRAKTRPGRAKKQVLESIFIFSSSTKKITTETE